jgi:hypothetical protein
VVLYGVPVCLLHQYKRMVLCKSIRIWILLILKFSLFIDNVDFEWGVLEADCINMGRHPCLRSSSEAGHRHKHDAALLICPGAGALTLPIFSHRDSCVIKIFPGLKAAKLALSLKCDCYILILLFRNYSKRSMVCCGMLPSDGSLTSKPHPLIRRKKPGIGKTREDALG